MSDHTPGPWVYEPEADDADDEVGKPNTPAMIFHEYVPGRVVAVAEPLDPSHWESRPGPFGQHVRIGSLDANARLMAAAPDLLAACEALDQLDCCTGYSFPEGDWPKLWDALEKARAAIARAKTDS